jgi:N-acetylglucosaminyldiphosphoundecaprenol N-acetyl-beta-D-mannosaminyltransferase
MHQLISALTPKSFRQYLADGIHSIEDITGTTVRSYRAPGFSLTKKTLWAYEILAECGIETDCSIFPANRAHGGYPGFPVSEPSLIQTKSGTIRELPVNTHSIGGRNIVFSGGGYFRMLPYPLIHRFTRKSDYVMSYFHPRDFDPGQPRISDLSMYRTFKSYIGLKKSQEKLEKWLDEFNFIDLREAIRAIDWTSVPTLIPNETQNKFVVSWPAARPESKIHLMGFTIHTKLDDHVLPVMHNASAATSEGVNSGTKQLLVNCMNPHSYCLSKKDPLFREALRKSDILIPDGTGIVMAAGILKFRRIHKIAGADLHQYLLEKLNDSHGSCFYLGASQKTLDLIRERLAMEYPNITAGFYSPPYKEEFTEEESDEMISAVNSEVAKWRSSENISSEVAKMRVGEISSPVHQLTSSPAHQLTNSPTHQFTSSPVLFIGLTAPKQEKWALRYKEQLNVDIICGIGAVFDFYAGTVKRSSPFWIKMGLEWLPRFVRDPRRLYPRVFVSGPLFLWDVLLYRIGIK